jgi:hypothetical protein
MSLKNAILAVSALSVSFSSNAALTSYTGAGGVGLVYSSVSDVTWTQDANLFKTLYDADNTIISKIASVTPVYNDPYWGEQTIDASHFNWWLQGIGETGWMTWWGAKAFINYLNNISYGGISQWRLPLTGNNPQQGYNRTGSELGQLFYSELRGTAPNPIPRPIPNTSFFDNEQAHRYWTNTEFGTANAWQLNGYNGFQDFQYKTDFGVAWAVTPGQVAPVPLPAASWLMISGLLGLFGLKRFKKQSLVP